MADLTDAEKEHTGASDPAGKAGVASQPAGSADIGQCAPGQAHAAKLAVQTDGCVGYPGIAAATEASETADKAGIAGTAASNKPTPSTDLAHAFDQLAVDTQSSQANSRVVGQVDSHTHAQAQGNHVPPVLLDQHEMQHVPSHAKQTVQHATQHAHQPASQVVRHVPQHHAQQAAQHASQQANQTAQHASQQANQTAQHAQQHTAAKIMPVRGDMVLRHRLDAVFLFHACFAFSETEYTVQRYNDGTRGLPLGWRRGLLQWIMWMKVKLAPTSLATACIQLHNALKAAYQIELCQVRCSAVHTVHLTHG